MGVAIVVLWVAVYRIALHLEGSVNLSYNYGVLLIIPEFLAGYWLFKIRTRLPKSSLINTVFFITSIVGMHFLAMQSTAFEILLLPLIMLLLISLLGTGLHNALFTNKISVYLGKISYSLYMTHYIVFTVIDQATRYLPKVIGVSVEMPALSAILLMIAVASLGYHLVEEPARHWVRKKFVTK
jgi:peptidoglycan/LPS O-acetylase OafA/YrhL